MVMVAIGTAAQVWGEVCLILGRPWQLELRHGGPVSLSWEFVAGMVTICVVTWLAETAIILAFIRKPSWWPRIRMPAFSSARSAPRNPSILSDPK
jgi:hypothetical protein